jgi:hypothetical protein
MDSTVAQTAYADSARAALLAKYYPTHAANPSAARATWCANLDKLVNQIWLNSFVTVNSGADGYWPEDVYSGNTTYPLASDPLVTGNYGAAPWRVNGLANLALIRAYDAYADATACNNSTTAASILSAVQKSAQFIYDYGRSPDGGLYYNVQYPTLSQSQTDAGVWINFQHPGNLSVTNNSTAVVGTQTTFTTTFACNGTDTIGIIDSQGTKRIYTVASCADATHLTLGSAYAGATESSRSYVGGGSIAVTNNSATVTGTGTAFTWLFAPCDGTTYIGIPGTNERKVYQVTACASATSLTISPAYHDTSLSGITAWSKTVRAPTSIRSPSIASYCESDWYNGRNLAHDAAASFAWLYWKTSVSSWLTKRSPMLRRQNLGVALRRGLGRARQSRWPRC